MSDFRSRADEIRAMTDCKLSQLISDNIDCERCKEIHQTEDGFCPVQFSEQCCPDFWLVYLKGGTKPVRTCQMCGKPFPEGTAPTRKFCIECRVIRSIEAKKRSKERRIERKKASPPPQPKNPHMVSKKDRDYCAKCIFRGSANQEHLCDYILLTGQSRGCKAGDGCTKRETEER